MIERLAEDVLGPSNPAEVLSDRPTDRYLLGFLSPKETLVGAEEDEQLGSAEDDENDAPVESTVSLSRTMKPSTMGISFAMRPSDVEAAPLLELVVSCGTYEALLKPENERGRRPPPEWKRTPHELRLKDVRLQPEPLWLDLSAHGLAGLRCFVRGVRGRDGVWSATAALVNDNHTVDDGILREQRTFFQTRIEVRAGSNTELTARPSRRAGSDPDSRAAALIYRGAREYAVGHTCSAKWELSAEEKIQVVSTEWLPRAEVSAMSSAGDEALSALSTHATSHPLSPAWLVAEATDEQLAEALAEVPNCYERWIASREQQLDTLETSLKSQGRKHLDVCRDGARRMREAVELVRTDETVRHAFRLAQQAMRLQYHWGRQKELRWYPFQLGFQLLALASLARREHPDREVMDLLWFPTGGGKTEAYLALTAFVLFLRRLRDGVRGAGISVLMRYTLRLLTIQQCERASAMICACELLRRGMQRPPGLEALDLGQDPFSIGLWVGGGATPNTVKAAHASKAGESPDPRQLTFCPCCRQKLLRWGKLEPKKQFSVECVSSKCEFAQSGRQLPVWTVDEDIYRVRPSLLLGTVDKFAQIVRTKECSNLFAVDDAQQPMDLVIQDELHLISGPLGTIAALYEIAIDELCTRGAVRPKVLGSTATIRRADEQVLALFARRTYQFPSPGLDADNSGFAVRDRSRPGRLYVGLSSIGRSPKFALQASAASLLQSAQPNTLLKPEELDGYRTLVGYFNSLRELGGALVLMMDDVTMSISQLAKRRVGEDPRRLEEPQELTSRVGSVREVLDRIERPFSSGEAVDVLLASTMISVGVDVPRLSLMLVNGQPKGIADYIQTTSRVGRGAVPGLVVVLYNDSKTRDRAHYETFATWHQTLYREVEATSVTPFSPRAIERAAHAALVALARYTVKGLLASPRLSQPAQRSALKSLVDKILHRVDRIEPAARAEVAKHLTWFCDGWIGNDRLEEYWDDTGKKVSLLVSAERAVAMHGAGDPGDGPKRTLNSMREVEPSTTFTLRPVFKQTAEEADHGEA